MTPVSQMLLFKMRFQNQIDLIVCQRKDTSRWVVCFFKSKIGVFFVVAKIIRELKSDGKKWSRIYFEIHRAPSEIPAKLPGQFRHSGQIFLHWAEATLKGLGEFQNKKSRSLFTINFL